MAGEARTRTDGNGVAGMEGIGIASSVVEWQDGNGEEGRGPDGTEWQEWSGADRMRMDWRGQAGMERTGK